MSPAPPNHDYETAINIPGYEVIGKIGAGGMGAVYKARQLTLNRFVAIKVVDPRLMDRPDYSELTERLKREAHAAASLADDTIVRVIEFVEGKRPAIVMEYVEGRNLKDLLDLRGRPPVNTALLILGDMCRALERAHTRGIIHRDIKPANVLLTSEGKDSKAKVMDFGLARIEQVGSDLTLSGTIMGTPHYMSPEQAKGRRDLTAQTDIFSLGVVAYQLFSGSRPFDGDSYHDITNAIINEEPHTLAELVSGGLPDEISQTVHAMLRKDVAERIPSIGMVRTVVDGLISRASLEGHRELMDRWVTGADMPRGENETQIPPHPTPEPPTVPDPPRPPVAEPPTIPGSLPNQPKRRGYIPVLVGVTAVAAILVAGWWLVPRFLGGNNPVAGSLSVVVRSEPPTSQPVRIDEEPHAWGRPIHLAAGRLHWIQIGSDPAQIYWFGVPEGSGQLEYTVHLNRGIVTLGSEAVTGPLRYRLTSSSADITITSMSPAPAEPGFVSLNAGEVLEIEATSPGGEQKRFSYAAKAGDVEGIMFLDFEQGTLYPVTLYPVDL